MDITNLDANVWQYFFAFMEHNKIFTLILVFMAAVFLLLIKKIVKIPCNIFTGKVERLAKAGKEVTYETDAQ